MASERVQADFTTQLLIQAADNALYRPKAAGRNRVAASIVGKREGTVGSLHGIPG
jgi:PleD family two-component response regulator